MLSRVGGFVLGLLFLGLGLLIYFRNAKGKKAIGGLDFSGGGGGEMWLC
jgi:hypothetical protein